MARLVPAINRQVADNMPQTIKGLVHITGPIDDSSPYATFCSADHAFLALKGRPTSCAQHWLCQYHPIPPWPCSTSEIRLGQKFIDTGLSIALLIFNAGSKAQQYF
jgi:hypothetical protein